jgi:glycosyltransferase involved in cell wall biosynthesis
VRLLSLAELLGRLGFAVHWVHVERWKGDVPRMEAFWGERLVRIPYRRPPGAGGHRKRGRLWQRLGIHSTHRVDEWYDPGLDAPLRAFEARVRPRVVIVNYVFLSKALDAFGPGAFKVLDTQDVFTNRHRLMLRSGQEPHFFYTTRRQERRALERADVVMAIQEEEAVFFRGLTRRPVATVGHAVAIRDLPESDAEAGLVLFLASHNPANVHGVRHLLDDVRRLVLDAAPRARFVLAGGICEHVPDEAGYEKLGLVEDVADAYRRAQVVVCPVVVGTGLKVKIVEALGCARPVVATPHAVAGLDLGRDDGVLVAEDAKAFADSVLHLLQDGARRRSAGRAAHAFAERYDARCLEQLRALLALGGR